MSGATEGDELPLTRERAEAIYRELLALDLASTEAVVCLASVRGKISSPTFQQLLLTDDLAEYFRSLPIALLKELKEKGRVLQPYAVGSILDPQEIEYLALAEYADLSEQVAPLDSIADVPLFDRSPGFAANLRFYTIIAQRPHATPVYFFRWYSPKQELSRSRHVAALFHQDRYDLIKEDVLLFDREIDCVIFDGAVFILNKGLFERIFRFFELIQERAETTLVEIESKFTAHVRTLGFEGFADACKRDIRKLKKLNEIAKKPYLHEIDIVAIQRVVERYPHLRPLLGQDEGEQMLLFDGADPWLVLRLLDDGYLESIMTRQQYEVNSKRPLES